MSAITQVQILKMKNGYSIVITPELIGKFQKEDGSLLKQIEKTPGMIRVYMYGNDFFECVFKKSKPKAKNPTQIITLLDIKDFCKLNVKENKKEWDELVESIEETMKER